MKRVLGAVLMLATACPSAFGGDFDESVKKAAAAAAQSEAKSDGRNRYLLPGIALVGAGTVMALVGFLRPNGVDVAVQQSTVSVPVSLPFSVPLPITLPSTVTVAVPSITATTTHNTGLGIVGLGIAGVGSGLLIVGVRKDTTQIVQIAPGRIAVMKTVRF
jgi:hypothetical protein